MPLACDEEHVQLRQLLRSLQAAEHVDWNFSEWWNGGFGTSWYKRVAQECSNLLRVAKDEGFTNELTALQARCTAASLNKSTIGTHALVQDMLRLWTPLAPKLETFLTQVDQNYEKYTKGRGLYSDQRKYAGELRHSMAGFAFGRTTNLGAETRVDGLFDGGWANTLKKTNEDLVAWRRDTFGQQWYRDMSSAGTNLIHYTIRTQFKFPRDDFRENLKSFCTRCDAASLAPNTSRTPAIHNEILLLWKPLQSPLETFRASVNKKLMETTLARGELADQYHKVDFLLTEMAMYVPFCEERK